MAKASLVNREMSHTYTHIYIYVTQITKWGLKIQLNYSKYIIFFFKLDLVITLKHPCHSKGAFLHKQEKNIWASQRRFSPKPCSLDNIAAWGNRLLPAHGGLAGVLQDQKKIKVRGGVFFYLHYEWDFLPHCPRRQLLTIIPSGARNGGIINPLDLSVQKRWPLQQWSGASLQPSAHSKAGIQSSYQKVKSAWTPLSGGSAGAKGEGSGGRACQHRGVMVSPLQPPLWWHLRTVVAHTRAPKTWRRCTDGWAWDRELPSSGQEPNSAKKASLALALQEEKLSEPILPKVAADLHSVAASVKHEGLIFRRWEA